MIFNEFFLMIVKWRTEMRLFVMEMGIMKGNNLVNGFLHIGCQKKWTFINKIPHFFELFLLNCLFISMFCFYHTIFFLFSLNYLLSLIHIWRLGNRSKSVFVILQVFRLELCFFHKLCQIGFWLNVRLILSFVVVVVVQRISTVKYYSWDLLNS